MPRWVHPSLAVVLAALFLASCARLCSRRGHYWFVSRADPDARGQCLVPAADAGKPCIRGRKCSRGYCQCTWEQRELRVGDPATGSCPTFRPLSGEGWTCMIEDGRVQGSMIVD